MPKLKIQPSLSLIKQCTRCGEEKDSSQFYKQSASLDGLQKQCMLCASQRNKEKWINDSQYKQKSIQKARLWQKNNSIQFKKTNKQYRSLPWKRIPMGLNKRLRENTCFKSKICLKPDQLKIYIESLWKPNMTWENYGKLWVITRIKHIPQFNLNDPMDVMKINHYTNLMPVYFHEVVPISKKSIV